MPTTPSDRDTSVIFYQSHNLTKTIPYSGLTGRDGVGQSNMLIDYVPAKSFSTISFVDAYTGKFDPKLVEGKLVLIGPTATGDRDEYQTPIGVLP